MSSAVSMLLRLSLLLGLWVSLLAGSLPAQSLPPAEAERDLTLPIRVGVSEVAYPYSFRDSDGELKGFSVDLMNAVARVMELKILRAPLGQFSVNDALRSGQVDMLQSWSETPARRPYTSFSAPYLRCETVVVIHKDDHDIHTIDDLNGRQVAVGQKGNVGDHFIDDRAPRAIKVFRESSLEFLRLLDNHECDAAVISRLTVASHIKRLGLKNLRILDAKLQGYDVRYCFAVRRGDDLLLARLNEGLAILNRTGEYEDIYNKWFGQYEKTSFTPLQLTSAIAGVLAVSSIFAFLAFLRQRKLSAHISHQAEELTRQRTLLAALHDNHPLATIVLDLPAADATASPDPRLPVSAKKAPELISLNHQAALLFSLPNKLPAQVDLNSIALNSDTQAFFDAVLTRWRTQSDAPHWEFPLPDSKRWLEVFLVPLGPDALGHERLCILAGDVTSRRAMDQEIALSRRQRALGELVGGVAHEFNNLLTPIIATTSQLYEERSQDENLLGDIRTIEEAARRGAELTRRLLTFGRRRGDQASAVLLTESVQNSIELLRHTIDRRITLSCEENAGLPPLLFDRTDLNQIIFNLLINARDTLNEKLAQQGRLDWQPSITISYEDRPAKDLPLKVLPKGRTLAGWQTLSVRDNGMGIPAEIMDRIYEPFFTTKEVGTGTGLGLATTWHIVNEAGGNIEIDSRVGEYTTFRVTFPRWAIPEGIHPQENKPTVHQTSGTGQADTPQPPAGNLRILFAEDEDSVAKVVTRILQRLGHTVIRCRDGVEALETLQASPAPVFDVILLDMNMPRMNGLDLAKRLHEDTTKARVFVMSGRVSDEDQARLRELGVEKILHKPISVDILRKALV